MTRKAHQLLAAPAGGCSQSAIEDAAASLRNQIRSWGFQSEIYREGDSLTHRLASDDFLLYRLSAPSPAATRAYLSTPCRKALVFQGLPPSHFFAPYDMPDWLRLNSGRDELSHLKTATERAFSESQSSVKELEAAGFRDVHVLPPLTAAFDPIQPDAQLLAALNDKTPRFLCADPLTPDKRQEDVIRVFAWYSRFIDPDARLVLTGEAGSPAYQQDLVDVCYTLGAQSRVMFTGSLSPSQEAALYSTARLLISMSEYDASCPALLRAMHWNLPVLAYANAGAVETLGTAGAQLTQKNVPLAAEAACLLATDGDLRTEIVQGQSRRLRELREREPDSELRRWIQ